MNITNTTTLRSGKRTNARRAPARRKAPARPDANEANLPGWKELAKTTRNARRKRGKAAAATPLDAVTTSRFTLLIAGLAVALAVYVHHVYQTQAVLAELQMEQRERQRLHLKFNRLKGELDRLTGPSVVYDRAVALGLEPDAAFGPSIAIVDAAP